MGLTSVYHAPVAVKVKATPGDVPGSAGVTADREGPPDNPGGHHVAALVPPRAPLGTPRSARIRWKTPEHSGMRRPTGQCPRPPGLPGTTRGDLGRL